jgi:hypothetical protein
MPEYERRASDLGVRYFLIKSRDHERLPELIQDLATQRAS